MWPPGVPACAPTKFSIRRSRRAETRRTRAAMLRRSASGKVARQRRSLPWPACRASWTRSRRAASASASRSPRPPGSGSRQLAGASPPGAPGPWAAP
eukprot:4724025-Alexandrium_andersonii.AAC.1